MKNIKAALIVTCMAVVLGMLFFFYQIMPKDNLSGSSKSKKSTNNQDIAAEQASVEIKGFAFKPFALHITRGSTVSWTNKDDAKHNVVDDGGAFASNLLDYNQNFRFTYDHSGTFTYHCSKHPSEKGTITVN